MAILSVTVLLLATGVLLIRVRRGWDSWGHLIAWLMASFSLGFLRGLSTDGSVASAAGIGLGTAAIATAMYWGFGQRAPSASRTGATATEPSPHPSGWARSWPIILVLIIGAIARIIDTVSESGSAIWWVAVAAYAGACCLALASYGRMWLRARRSAHRTA